jgi:hypothetical protein
MEIGEVFLVKDYQSGLYWDLEEGKWKKGASYGSYFKDYSEASDLAKLLIKQDEADFIQIDKVFTWV